METQNTLDSQELPKQLSDAAWAFYRSSETAETSMYETCRHFLSAVLWIAKEGATWRALPKVYGNWNAIYRRFSRWCDVGVFQALHEHFHDAGDISGILIDSTIVRAHASAAGAPKKKEDKKHRHSDELEADLRRN